MRNSREFTCGDNLMLWTTLFLEMPCLAAKQISSSHFTDAWRSIAPLCVPRLEYLKKRGAKLLKNALIYKPNYASEETMMFEGIIQHKQATARCWGGDKLVRVNLRQRNGKSDKKGSWIDVASFVIRFHRYSRHIHASEDTQRTNSGGYANNLYFFVLFSLARSSWGESSSSANF